MADFTIALYHHKIRPTFRGMICMARDLSDGSNRGTPCRQPATHRVRVEYPEDAETCWALLCKTHRDGVKKWPAFRKSKRLDKLTSST